MASTSRMWERNLLPNPSPSEAPLTSPAMSTNSTTAGIVFFERLNALSRWSRSSGTGTIPTDGSIVQKGEFSAGTLFLVSALKSVDFPTFGRPTMPIESDMRRLYLKTQFLFLSLFCHLVHPYSLDFHLHHYLNGYLLYPCR